MNMRLPVMFFALLCVAGSVCGGSLPTAREVLPAAPWNYGIPDITDRAYWEARPNSPVCINKIKRADKVDVKSLAVPSDELYLEFARNGNRSRYEQAYFKLFAPLNYLLIAACATDDPKHIRKLEALLENIAAMKTWCLPAHDRDLANFYGKRVDIDLRSSLMGSIVAQALYMAGPRLSPALREKLHRLLTERIVTPFADMVDGKRPKNFWLEANSNWNAVCLSEVGSTLLAMKLEPELRWRLLDATVRYLPNYLSGFQDGYCSEGLGYWNYGFGRYVRYAVTLAMASGGKLDLMTPTGARDASMFPERIRIVGELYPAFADSGIRTKASVWVEGWRDYQLGRNSAARQEIERSGNPTNLMDILMQMAMKPGEPGKPEPLRLPPSSLFRAAGVACLRPGAVAACKLSAAIKGGSNHELHNHNDVGSYILVVGDRSPVVVDPGAERYTARTFSKNRYESDLLNSFGHSVPVIDGKGQCEGAGTDAPMLRFEDDGHRATAVFDLRPAYPADGTLLKLERQFDYDRADGGSFRVADRVEFKDPAHFETAVITCGTVEKIDDRTLVLRERDGALRLTVESGGLPVEISWARLKAVAADGGKPLRIAIRIPGKIRSGLLQLSYVPEKKDGL